MVLPRLSWYVFDKISLTLLRLFSSVHKIVVPTLRKICFHYKKLFFITTVTSFSPKLSYNTYRFRLLTYVIQIVVYDVFPFGSYVVPRHPLSFYSHTITNLRLFVPHYGLECLCDEHRNYGHGLMVKSFFYFSSQSSQSHPLEVNRGE